MPCVGSPDSARRAAANATGLVSTRCPAEKLRVHEAGSATRRAFFVCVCGWVGLCGSLLSPSLALCLAFPSVVAVSSCWFALSFRGCFLSVLGVPLSLARLCSSSFRCWGPASAALFLFGSCSSRRPLPLALSLRVLASLALPLSSVSLSLVFPPRSSPLSPSLSGSLCGWGSRCFRERLGRAFRLLGVSPALLAALL